MPDAAARAPIVVIPAFFNPLNWADAEDLHKMVCFAEFSLPGYARLWVRSKHCFHFSADGREPNRRYIIPSVIESSL